MTSTASSSRPCARSRYGDTVRSNSFLKTCGAISPVCRCGPGATVLAIVRPNSFDDMPSQPRRLCFRRSDRGHRDDHARGDSANRQFDEVRRLAHTVLFDYHDAIANLPGSTPVRQKLVKDALGYLDGLSQQTQDEGLEREIALAYVKVADVQGNTYNPNLGDTAGGIESARKAVAHAEPLYRKTRVRRTPTSSAGPTSYWQSSFTPPTRSPGQRSTTSGPRRCSKRPSRHIGTKTGRHGTSRPFLQSR